MKCPIDGNTLKQVKRHRMEVEQCPECKGMWLSAPELDQLEDRKFDQDHLKGSLLISTVETSLPCPDCEENLQEFKYRFYELRLDRCPNQHGFWLDHTEDKRILQIMVKRGKDINRMHTVNAMWAKRLKQYRWFSYLNDPDSCTEVQTSKPHKLPPYKEARPPATPVKQKKKVSSSFKRLRLPSTCPRCGGPINSMTVIMDKTERFTCGYCHTYLQPA